MRRKRSCLTVSSIYWATRKSHLMVSVKKKECEVPLKLLYLSKLILVRKKKKKWEMGRVKSHWVAFDKIRFKYRRHKLLSSSVHFQSISQMMMTVCKSRCWMKRNLWQIKILKINEKKIWQINWYVPHLHVLFHETCVMVFPKMQ